MKFLTPLCAVLILLPLGVRGQGAHDKGTSYFKRFEGTIGKQPVVMYLERRDDNLKGSYFYSNVQQSITLWQGWADEKYQANADSVVLVEQVSGDTAIHTLAMHFTSASTMQGIWSGNGTTAPIALKEFYPDGYARLDPYWSIDSVTTTLPHDHHSTVSSSYKILLPAQSVSTEKASAILRTVSKMLGCQQVMDRAGLRGCIRTLEKADCDSDRASILEMTKDMQDSDLENESYLLKWYSSVEFSVRYNENDLLILNEDVSRYAGGAHESFTERVQVLDLASGKELTLSDITTADSLTLQRLLATAFRKEYNLTHNQRLSEVLFEDYLPANTNFYVTQKGLGFLYNPYEVASWAVGLIDVYIPFSALKGKLTPWLIERMRL